MMDGNSKDRFIPFALPDIGEEEIAAVVQTLRGGWLTTGPRTEQFETEFARYIGSDVRAIAVNSATAGLHLALEAVGIGPGDEVITTPYTFTATAEVIRYLGADPVFCDVREDTLNIDPEQIESAITARTKAIIPVHFAGLACDMDKILKVAARHNLRVIEDAAHALPAKFDGRIVGSLGSDATVFSFYATKPLATGEGGMVVTRDPAIAKRCSIMRLHGIDRDVFNRYTSDSPAWFYRVVAPGFKYNMTDVAAAIGIEQLRKLDRMHRRRSELAERYDVGLNGLCLRLPVTPWGNMLHAWHLYVVRLDEDAPVTRDQFIEQLAAAGIGTSVHFIPLHLHPYWRDTYRLKAESFPNASAAFKCVLSLPLFSAMTNADQDRVVGAVRSILTCPAREFAAPSSAAMT
jgi:dTDP-4-amino-4,6-dideoxygalactose transaminase